MDKAQGPIYQGDPNTFEGACQNIATEIAQLVISKHKDYGPSNILTFKEKGLVVRLSDKINRLQNLIWENNDPSHEAVEDTFMDIAGYAIIGIMLTKGTFTNKLEK